MEVLDEYSSGIQYGLFKCDCGNVKKQLIRNVIREKTPVRSCGCEKMKLCNKITPGGLGLAHKKTHTAWNCMLRRCYDKNFKDYFNYGGRGISVCEEWKSFENFLKDMGDKPEGLTLDRIDTNGNYEKSNCRWTDNVTQQRNRNCTLWVNAFGELISVSDYARKYGVVYETAKWNHYNGKDMENLAIRHKEN